MERETNYRNEPDGDCTVEEWVGPFRRALALHGRPARHHMWHIIWGRKLAVWAGRWGKQLRDLNREEAETFLATHSSSPGIAPWQLAQATDAIRILFGSVFGQDWGRLVRPPDPLPPSDIIPPAGNDPLDQLRYAIRCRRYSPRTEKSYVFWAERYLTFLDDTGAEAGADTVRAFLERLVIHEELAGATQAQALSRWIRWDYIPTCLGAQVSKGSQGMGMAVRLSREAPYRNGRDGKRPQASHA